VFSRSDRAQLAGCGIKFGVPYRDLGRAAAPIRRPPPRSARKLTAAEFAAD